jgi:hypothetical protein
MADHESTQADGTDADAELTEQVTEHVGSHELPDGAPRHPLIDLTRDPTPGKPDHARPDDD